MPHKRAKAKAPTPTKERHGCVVHCYGPTGGADTAPRIGRVAECMISKRKAAGPLSDDRTHPTPEDLLTTLDVSCPRGTHFVAWGEGATPPPEEGESSGP